MTNEVPQVNETGRYDAAATCAALQIDRTTLWRYTKKGLILPSFRRTGKKFYKGSEILRFWRSIL